ncbi:MAG: ATPase domain-containing protein, partial [Candidatus Micrarchaeota archaeon]
MPKGVVKTGVDGLDDMLGGGIPKGNVVLLSGQAGTGKTIFSLQYLYNGSSNFKEKGLYITFEETREDILEQAKHFGWDFEELEKAGMIKILTFSITKHQDLVTINKIIRDTVNEHKPKRLVFDSISAFTVWAEIRSGLELLESMGFSHPQEAGYMPSGEGVTRAAIAETMRNIKEMDLTALIVSELPEKTDFLSRDTISEFLADGVITLNYAGV